MVKDKLRFFGTELLSFLLMALINIFWLFLCVAGFFGVMGRVKFQGVKVTGA